MFVDSIQNIVWCCNVVVGDTYDIYDTYDIGDTSPSISFAPLHLHCLFSFASMFVVQYRQ